MKFVLPTVRLVAAVAYIFLWAAIGWSDFRFKKIKTRSIFYGTLGALAGYALLASTTWFGQHGIGSHYLQAHYYFAAAQNALICALTALALWFLGVWPAGDAKLFILLGVLYPLTTFSDPSDFHRLFFSALVNAFLPASVYVFIQAGKHALETRLFHRRHFLVQLGWRKEFSFLLNGMRAGFSRLWLRRKRVLVTIRKDIRHPRAVAEASAKAVAGLLMMSTVSYYAASLFTSPVLYTALWAGAYYAWAKIPSADLRRMISWCVAIAVVVLLLHHPPQDISRLVRIFENFALFSLFFYLSSGWGIKILSEDANTAYLLAFVVPFAGMLLGLMAFLLGFARAAGAQTLLMIAAMGGFLGLNLALVRLWDHEVTPLHFDYVTVNVLLAPEFIRKLRADESFFNEHFSRLYPDGLTSEQVSALKEWCARHGVERIQLTPTISFASWIFVGFFATWLLGGMNYFDLLR